MQKSRKNDLPLSPPLTPSSSIRTQASTSDVHHDVPENPVNPGDPVPTRFLLVGNILSSVSPDVLNTAIFAALTHFPARHDDDGPVKGVFVRCLEKGFVILAFHDLRDAIAAKDFLATLCDGPLSKFIGDKSAHFTSQFVPQDSLVSMLGNSGFLKSMDASFFIAAEEQSILEDAVASLSINDREPDADVKRPINVAMLKRFLESHGTLRSFEPVKSDVQPPRSFCVEFFDIRDSVSAYSVLSQGANVLGMKLRVFGRNDESNSTSSEQSSFTVAGHLSQTRERFVPVADAPESPAIVETEDKGKTLSLNTDLRSRSPTYFYTSTTTPPETTVRSEEPQKPETKPAEPPQTPREPQQLRPPPNASYYAPQMDGFIYPPLEAALHPYYASPATPPIPYHPSNYFINHPQIAQPVYPHAGNSFAYDYDPHACQPMNMMSPWGFDPSMGLVYPPTPAYPGTEYWCPTPTGIHNVAPYMPMPPQMNGHGHQQPSCFPPVPVPTPAPVFSHPSPAAAPVPGHTPSPPHPQTSLQPSRPSQLLPNPNPSSAANGNSKEISERNQLNLAKIEDGQDTRTTVMIKNIPNKMSDKDLIAYINKVVPRRIDFIYLRMDFSNGCNVGYAFVNFITVQDLLTFAKKRLGQKWNMFSSDKILHLSYANYQGKEALVEKFKNSCIMDEREAWQPKIFYSEPGPEQGLPEPFPAATHQRRKERSSHNRGALYVPGTSGGVGGHAHGGLLHHTNFQKRHHHHGPQEERAGKGKHRRGVVSLDQTSTSTSASSQPHNSAKAATP